MLLWAVLYELVRYFEQDNDFWPWHKGEYSEGKSDKIVMILGIGEQTIMGFKEFPEILEIPFMVWWLFLWRLDDSGVLLEEGDDLLMSTFSFGFSLVPDGLEVVSVCPANLDGSGDTLSRVSLDIDLFSKVLLDVVLQPGGRTSVSSWTTVLNIDSFAHNKNNEFFNSKSLYIQTMLQMLLSNIRIPDQSVIVAFLAAYRRVKRPSHVLRMVVDCLHVNCFWGFAQAHEFDCLWFVGHFYNFSHDPLDSFLKMNA